MFKGDHGASDAAVRFFSDLTVERRLSESRRRSAVGLSEGGAEMTVAGEAEIEAQGRQIIVLIDQIKRSREPQPHLVAIERHTLDPLEDLREVDRGSADFGGDL